MPFLFDKPSLTSSVTPTTLVMSFTIPNPTVSWELLYPPSFLGRSNTNYHKFLKFAAYLYNQKNNTIALGVPT